MNAPSARPPPPPPVVRLRTFAHLVTLAVVAVLGSGCGGTSDAPKQVTVFAAASLTDVLPEVAAAWKTEGGVEVRFSFGASSKLVPQVIEGAPADVLVSADAAWMDKLEAAGKTEPGSRAILARNELVYVVPGDAGNAPTAAAELPGEAKKIALAGENVPAGRYAESALEKAGVWAAVEPRVVRTEDVRLTLRWVASGEADGGVVYRTDARAEAKVRVAFAFPSDSHAPIVYPGAVVRGAARSADATRFLAFCRGDKARAIFERFGFLPPAP
jgi:molybdate transport system substrate-binding protein